IVVFILIAVAIIGGIHTYIWWRLIRDTALPQPWRTVATVALLLLALLVPAAMIVRRGTDERALAELLYWPAMIWLRAMFITFVVLLATDVVRLGILLAGARPSDPGRRVFIRRLWGGVISAASAATVGVALVEATRVRVKEVTVPLRRLPQKQDGT